ncbi:MAG: sigma-70 family RNA polymerase sigma factor [Acidimicrobiales bacterium]
MDSSAFATEAEYRARFETLFRDNYRRVRQYVARRVPPSRVDDVVASSFTIAWQKFTKVENPSLPWMIRIASFEVSNAERKARRTISDIRVDSLNDLAEVGADDFDGESVRSALTRLSRTDQEVLRLVHWDGLSRVDIAEVLGLTHNAVNVRYHRALKKFESEINPFPSTPTQEGILP